MHATKNTAVNLLQNLRKLYGLENPESTQTDFDPKPMGVIGSMTLDAEKTRIYWASTTVMVGTIF